MRASRRRSCPNCLPTQHETTHVQVAQQRAEIGAPCGVPRPSSLVRVVRCTRPAASVSSTGVTSHRLMRLQHGFRHRCDGPRDLINSACGMLSKYPLRSASTTCKCPVRSNSDDCVSPHHEHCGPVDRRTALAAGRPRRSVRESAPPPSARHDRQPWESPTVSACHPAWESTPAGPAAADTTDSSIPSASSDSHRFSPYSSMSSNVWPSTPATPPLRRQRR